MQDHMRKELVISALQMAISQRKPDAGCIHHSDQGSQGGVTAVVLGERCASAGIEPSTGSKGDCFDNACSESFHATLKKQLIYRHTWATRAEARTAIFEYIEGWYNPHRRHSTLGYPRRR
jgi:putative transposase